MFSFFKCQSFNWKKEENNLILMYPRVLQVCREIHSYLYDYIFHPGPIISNCGILQSPTFGTLFPGSVWLWWPIHGAPEGKHPSLSTRPCWGLYSFPYIIAPATIPEELVWPSITRNWFLSKSVSLCCEILPLIKLHKPKIHKPSSHLPFPSLSGLFSCSL